MKTIIEVGAHKGKDTIKWVVDPENKVYSFEPNYRYAHMLRKKMKSYPNHQTIEMAVDLENSESPRLFYTSGACSSLHTFSADLKEKWRERHHWNVDEVTEVNAIRLDTFLSKEGIESVDYLWIDAQGNDFRVLQSLGEFHTRIKEGRCESAYNINLYKNVNNSTEDICKWLKDRNFEYEIVPDEWNMEADILFKSK